jgi:type I restriction enzyme M protein
MMNPLTISQRELESRLWSAATSLRQSPVDSSDLKSYIFPLLFFKSISDTWDEEHANALAKLGSQLNEKTEEPHHIFVLPDGCRWSDLRKKSVGVGYELVTIFDKIQQANPKKLDNIFGNMPWSDTEKMPEQSLISLISDFDTLNLSPLSVSHDILGAAYEYLLKQFADISGKKAGEFFTPRAVVRLITRIVHPTDRDSVYDPACGSGGMLIEASNEVKEDGRPIDGMKFFGQELQFTTAALARMNLYIHDLEDSEVRRGNTLKNPKFLTKSGKLEQYDVIISNPPFSLKNWGADTWKNDPYGRANYGVPPNGNGDMAWILHILASMKPKTGRAGVVMPHGVLFRGGQEGAIRAKIIQSGLLEAIIGLPSNLFYSTGIPACILVFRSQAAPRDGVLFVDGSKRFRKIKNQSEMNEHDINAILHAYQNQASGDDVDVRLVPMSEIEENKWDLSVGRYIAAAKKEVLDVGLAIKNLAASRRELDEAEAHLVSVLRQAGYDIEDLAKEQ